MRSEFAEAVYGLIYHADMFAIGGWVQFFSVVKGSFKQSQIKAWFEDESIPTPSQLFMMYDCVKNHDCDQRWIEQFKVMAEKRSTLVSPHGKLMLPTVWQYMTRTAFDEVSSKMAKLNTNEEKEALLISLYPEVLYVSNSPKARAEGRDKSWYDEEARREPPAWQLKKSKRNPH
jgi:hypothetical protein